VPIAGLDAPARRALTYAASVAGEVIAVHVETRADEPADETRAIARGLRGWKPELGTRNREAPVKLTCIESPYRSIIPPVLAYVDSWRAAHPEPTCTVVLPELVTDRWWAHWLHNHRAFWLKAALLTRSTVAVADVTYHLPRPGR
jgi:hypothetical protein